MPAENMVNTNELRFVSRLERVPVDRSAAAPLETRVRYILQQRWVVIGTAFGDPLTDKNSEWRDVPLVDKPQTASEIADVLVATGNG